MSPYPDERTALPEGPGEPLRILYVLASVELFGGVKVVLEQANLLHDLGHRVCVASPSPAPDWFRLRADFQQLPSLATEHLSAADLYVATFYTTLEPALAAAQRHGGRAVHLCQGFEGALSHNTAEHPAIERAYRLPLPALVVSRHLEQLVSSYGRPARRIPQPLDAQFHPRDPLPRQPGEPARILVTGVWEFYLKGVPLAVDAIEQVREKGIRCSTIRLAQWPLGDDERARHAPVEYHHHLAPQEVAELVRSCDLLLAPSWPVEGFGLPVLEAFASGVPVVASDIPSYRDYAGEAASLVPYDDAAAFADAATQLLRSPPMWRTQRRRGLEISELYREARVAAQLDAAVRWARSVEVDTGISA